MSRSRSIGLSAAALTGLAAGILALAPAVVAGSSSADAARARHESIVRHWTPERMKAAVPRDRVSHPAKRPGGGGGGGTVTGASWTGGGEVLQATGKVYFEMDGGAWVCTGTAVQDGTANRSIVATAGHCAIDESTGEFATNWLFIPDFDAAPTFTCSRTKYGCWTATALVVDRAFATAGGFDTQATINDWAFAVVGPGGKSGSQQLDAAVPAQAISFAGLSTGQSIDSFGYPAAGKYHGNDLSYCAGNVFHDSLNDNLTWGLSCDMTGGSSGGPWLSSFNASTGRGTVSGLNSYGYSGVRNLYGPQFDADTQSTFNAAKSASTNTVVAAG
ncbi:MAG TPA: hypothetical protein VFI28_04635 [Candidatus Limnocylindrales bacterium]|nr:hypothetical protein [Candidatus Limnocylindrales bacterium]